ncbi:hypothetical protein GCM10023188_42770 [Pontibacter saemangeumensis]|uniref:Rhodanese domain-containing protein n=1 Tax=Pontibacter saemangeumensis TaxID=1084525 RepID=A0ABP8M2B8_9BACT
MKAPYLLFAGVLLLASCNADSSTSGNEVSNALTPSESGVSSKLQPISSQETKALLAQQADVVILDVRTPAEYEAGHLQGARLMDIYAADFQERLQALDPTKTYLVYCAVGGRSREALQLMGQLGFQQVYDASEGFSALKTAGVPVE